MKSNGPHDLGGQPAGPVVPNEHDPAFWEKRVDAMRMLLARGDNPIFGTDENRRAIESLGEDAYHRLSYYERWTAAMAALLIEKGVLTDGELKQRMADVERRWHAERQQS